MERIKKISTVLLIIFLPLVFLHCTKYKEPAPFFNGLFLEYEIKGKKIIFDVYAVIDNKNYKIVETEKSKVFGDETKELFVDAYGRVYKSSFKDYEGKFSPIWIPVNKIKINDTFDSGYKILRKDKWRKWDVMVIKNPDIEEERYFEVNTGYFVGTKGKFGMAYEVVLVDTNADIPTIEE